MTDMAEYVIIERDNDGKLVGYLRQFVTRPDISVGAGDPGWVIHTTPEVGSAWKFADRHSAEKQADLLIAQNPGRDLGVTELT